jgi:MFS family permease
MAGVQDEIGEEAIAFAERAGAGAAEAAKSDWTAASLYSLVFLTIISTLNYFDRGVIALVLPLIKSDLHVVHDTTMGVITSLVAVYAVIGVPVAMLADRWNRRNVVAIGCLFWSAMTVVTGFAGNVLQLGASRLLMAVGESCGVAPSQSMLSDIFSRARLPVAIAIFTCASSISGIVYSPVAGWIAQHHGWRMTFIAAGIPGLIFGLIFLLTVKEPPRHARAAQAGIGETLAFLAKSPAFWSMIVGGAFMGAYLYGVGAWGPTFLMRVHHLSVQTVGAVIAPVRGTISAGGILLGGALTSWLATRNEGWRGWLPGVSCLLLAPCEALFVFSDTDKVWITAMLFSSLFSVMNQPAVYSGLIAVARPRMRATAISFNLLSATVFGQFVGPILIGALNDALTAQYGDYAIRYSMLVVISCCILGGLSFFVGGYFMHRDAQRAAA